MISIVIPAYNEEFRIGTTLEKIQIYMNSNHQNYEIIVVDDGSKDKTINVVKSFNESIKIIRQERNQGKGAAVRRGILEASGDIRLFTDADLSTPIYEIEKVIKWHNEGFEVCIGSRALQSELIKEHQPFYREFMGKTFNKMVQFLVVKGIRDTQCGFKSFTAEAARKIFSNCKINGFAFDVEAVYLASKFNFKIKEIPIEWYNDDRSKLNPITDSSRMFFEILKIRKLHKDLN